MSHNRQDAGAVLLQINRMPTLQIFKFLDAMTETERCKVADLQQVFDAVNERWLQDQNDAGT